MALRVGSVPVEGAVGDNTSDLGYRNIEFATIMTKNKHP
jgi:hypothetical protein